MAANNRELAIINLHSQMLSSTGLALRYSAEWMTENERLNRKHGGSDTTEARIAKKESIELKDLMSKYQWHRDHATFCSNVLRLITDEAYLGQLRAAKLDSRSHSVPAPR